jgi:hypothetical protein
VLDTVLHPEMVINNRSLSFSIFQNY